MARVERIKLDEIYFKYKHHPNLVDLYVEGEFDRDTLNQFLKESKLSAFVSVFTANDVEMPNDLLVAMNLQLESNKHRLIGLATLLQEKLTGISSNVTCLVDADQDRLLGLLKEVTHLAYTKYTCMEMHCMSSEALHKFLVMACNLNEQHVSDFLDIAGNTLPCQFCFRAVNESIGLSAVMPAASRGLTKKNSLASFSSEKYLEAFVATNNLHRKRNDLIAEFDRLYAKLPVDVREKSHGHDFVELLFAFIAEKGGVKLHSGTAVTDFGGRLLMAVVSREELALDRFNITLTAAAQGGPRIWQK